MSTAFAPSPETLLKEASPTLILNHPTLKARQDEAKSAFEGLPTRAVETWKYTDLTRLLARHFSARKEDSPSFNGSTTLKPSRPCVPVHAESDLTGSNPQKAYCKTLEAALQKDPEPWASLFCRALNFKRHPMAAFALGHLHRAYCVDIPAQTRASEPLLVDCTHHDAGTWLNTVVLIRVQAHADVTLRFSTNQDPDSLSNQLILIDLAERSRCRLEMSTLNGGHQILGIHLWQAVDSQVHAFFANQGQTLGRYDLESNLQGERASIEAAGFFLLQNQDHVDHHLYVEHQADHTESRLFFKGIADQKGRGVFNGKSTVHHGIKNAQIQQKSQNLLLSKQAEIDTKPELEIYADQVKASHG
ncbi:MAG: hypothetical protein EBX40_05040, partial [Gammaproteobacteria bacterium]|nr:hypothetical protein [Gammaproteobacteria bacterium]